MGLIYDIHPDDEMLLYLHSLDRRKDEIFSEYMQTGYCIYATIREILQRFDRPLGKVDSLLDFASGHGRTTRFLLKDLPPNKITVSDIYASAVEFQSRCFGVKSFLSKADPDHLSIDHQYDVITCISLFSHLPEKLFILWLKKIMGACNDNGIFMFTTHGIELYTGKREPKREDYIFEPNSESRSLDVEIYGSTFVTYSFVENIVTTYFPEKRILAYVPKGLNNHQDIYVIGSHDEPKRSIDELHLPQGFIDNLNLINGRIIITGWACSMHDYSPIDTIHIHINETLMGNTKTGLARPDVVKHFNSASAMHSGFQGNFAYDEIFKNGVLSVEVVDKQGLPFRFYRRLPF